MEELRKIVHLILILKMDKITKTMVGRICPSRRQHFGLSTSIASILVNLSESKLSIALFIYFYLILLFYRSKTRTSWHLDLDSVRYVFEIEHSIMTGKKRLFRNNCIIHEEKSLRKLFNYEL